MYRVVFMLSTSTKPRITNFRKGVNSIEHNGILISDEKSLHIQIVSEIRKLFPHFMMVVQAGELQDTKEKRLLMWKKGFKGGQPDIMITNPHNFFRGLCLELKTPQGTGSLSMNQIEVLNSYHEAGWKVMVCSDLTSTILELERYNKGVRVMCSLCMNMYKSDSDLERHRVKFHHQQKRSEDNVVTNSLW